MISLATVETLLTDDATLMATATGGVWTQDESGARTGLSRTNTPGAFDGGIIKPTILLKLREAVPDYVLADDADQSVSLRQVLEVWYYEDSGYSNIETMRNRVYALLHATQQTGTFAVRWDGDVRPTRDLDLDANVARSDYLTRALRSVSA